MREYRYLVDRAGRIFHDGTEIVDPITLRFFLRAMTRTADGRWLVVCQGEHNWFTGADTPFVVQRLVLTVDRGRLVRAELVFAGDVREPLDPSALEVNDGRLGCRIRNGAFSARFGRVAMQQIAPFLVEDGDRPALALDGAQYPIRER
ncbi:MAG: hypothetical protein HYU51_18405 [Candidatus Rokubacteria bacterium]|nr:hypothetical protein [Candidatus Rokubacteria bacterium]